MTETLPGLLLRLSERGPGALLWGKLAAPYPERDIENLCARGVLVEQSPATDWAPCPDCDCGADSRPIVLIGEQLLAACPYDHRSDTPLEAADLRRFLIVPEALAVAVAAGAGMKASPQPIADGLWHLGATAGRAVFLGLAAQDLLHPGVVAIIRQAANGASATLLGPKLSTSDMLHLDNAGIHYVETAMALDPSGPTSGFLLDLARLVPAAANAKLFLRRSTGEVSVAGLSLSLTRQTLAVLEKLVDAALSGQSLVTHQDIEAALRRAPRDLIRDLRKAFQAAGMTEAETKRLIKSVSSRGYRLALQPSEIAVEP